MGEWIRLNNMVKSRDEFGAFQLDKDIEATRSYFLEHVNKKTMFFHNLKEKLDFLIEADYYEESVINQFTFEQVKEIFRDAYSYNFRFKSFMAAFKFYNNYALKTDDGGNYLERFEDRVAMNALANCRGDFNLAKSLVRTYMEQDFQPATPVFLNAGRKRSGRQVSCYIVDTPDSTEGIMYMEHATAQLSRSGGGVGINGTDLRASGDPIKGVEGAAGGPHGVAKQAENILEYFDQLGQRKGSGVFYLNAFHYNADDLLDAKKINADDAAVLKTISLGMLVPNKLFELAKNNEKMYVFSPYSIEKEYGVKLSEINMDEWYDTLVANPKVRKRQKDARQVLTKIAAVQQESGYPYLIFIDNANKQHALKASGMIKCSNLCVEIYQLQTSSKIAPYGKDGHEFGADISCVLGSLNVDNAMRHFAYIDRIIRDAVATLNSVVDNNVVDEVPTVKNGNEWFKSIGIGAMNHHGFLARSGIRYSDTEHNIDFSRTFYSTIRYYAIKNSMLEAKKTGEVFKFFEESEYYTGEIFEPYINENHVPKTKRVKELFKEASHVIPTPEDWKNLWINVRKYGMRNAYLMAVAPTGSISYVQNATPSVLPITEKIETRTYGDSTTHYPMPFLKEAFFTYESAYDIDNFKIIDVIAEIQKHVDQGISTTLFLDSNATTKDLVRLYVHAWKNNLKSIYYLRTKLKNETEECESCLV